MRKFLIAIITIAVLGVTGPSAPTIQADTTGKMYWAEPGTGTIRRASMDGSNAEDLVTGLDEPGAIVLDSTGGKMYWRDSGAGKIQRADLDGSNVQDLATGLDSPADIALELDGGKIYWTDAGSGKIQRADLGGSNAEDLVTGLVDPSDIELDITGSWMYWTDPGAGKTQRANLDGSGVQVLRDVSDSCPYILCPISIALDLDGGKLYESLVLGGIRRSDLDGSNEEAIVSTEIALDLLLDTSAGKIYWVDFWVGSPGCCDELWIRRANLDGSVRENLEHVYFGSSGTGANAGTSIAVDAGAGKMFWTDKLRGQISQSNLDGTGDQVLMTGLDSPGDIALDIPPGTDSDGDGCTDKHELGSNPALGGLRDPAKFWDFYDANRDGAVSGLDFFAVLSRFNAVWEPPLTKEEALAQAVEPPPPPPAYHASHDRTSPGPGDDPWDTGPPDGEISGLDFFAVLAQFNHVCA